MSEPTSRFYLRFQEAPNLLNPGCLLHLPRKILKTVRVKLNISKCPCKLLKF
jgi:hypothetical protein